MNKLPLHRLHEESGAHFSEFDTWILPERYSNPLWEYRAVRKNVALADLSHEGIFLLTGDDRKTFLQKLISNDLDLLTDNKGISTCLLTAKGKIISHFQLFDLSDGLSSEEALLIDVGYNNADNTKTQVMRYRMRSKVEMMRPNWGRLLVSGPKATALLESYFDTQLPLLEEHSFFQKKVGTTSVLCVKRSITGEEDYHLFMPAGKIRILWNGLLKAGLPLNLSLIGQKVLETFRIEAGLLRYGFDIDEERLPVEAGLASESISYTKGCYPGQEVMARLKTYGNVKKQLTGLIFKGESLPNRGDEIFHDNKAVGVVTSTVKSPFLGRIIALAYLRTTSTAPDTILDVQIGENRTAEASVTTLPFYKRSSD